MMENRVPQENTANDSTGFEITGVSSDRSGITTNWWIIPQLMYNPPIDII